MEPHPNEKLEILRKLRDLEYKGYQVRYNREASVEELQYCLEVWEHDINVKQEKRMKLELALLCLQCMFLLPGFIERKSKEGWSEEEWKAFAADVSKFNDLFRSPNTNIF